METGKKGEEGGRKACIEDNATFKYRSRWPRVFISASVDRWGAAARLSIGGPASPPRTPTLTSIPLPSPSSNHPRFSSRCFFPLFSPRRGLPSYIFLSNPLLLEFFSTPRGSVFHRVERFFRTSILRLFFFSSRRKFSFVPVLYTHVTTSMIFLAHSLFGASFEDGQTDRRFLELLFFCLWFRLSLFPPSPLLWLA